MAGYSNVPDPIGESNADHPGKTYSHISWIYLKSPFPFYSVLTPWLYKPHAPAGSRFTTGLAKTKIPRMYHSSASLLPDGSVIV